MQGEYDPTQNVPGQNVPPQNAPPQMPPYDVHHHYYYEPPRPMKGKSSKPSIAGALLLITAVLGIVAFGALLGLGLLMEDTQGEFTIFDEEIKGDITGTVVYLNGTPVVNAKVSIIGEPLSTQTDNEGNYIIYNIASGNHEIKVEKAGYNTIIYKTFISPSHIPRDQEDDFENEYDFTLSEGNEIIERGSYPPWELIRAFMMVCGVLIVIFSIIALVGAVNAFKRTNWGIAMLGAILGLFTIVGSLFALIAIFILVLSKDEFNKNYNENLQMRPKGG